MTRNLFRLFLVSLLTVPLVSNAQYLPLSGGTVTGYTQINGIHFSGNADNYSGGALWQENTNPFKTHLNGYSLSLGTGANGNRSERFYIDNSGNVGIGTGSPQARLHLADGDLLLRNSSSGFPKLYVSDITGNQRLKMDYKSVVAENSNLTLHSSGGNVLLVGYQLGFGTEAPRSAVEFVGRTQFSKNETGSSLFIETQNLSATDNWSNIRLSAGSDGGKAWLTSKIDNWGGYFNWVCNREGGEYEVMRINATNGNVGIGTNNPQAKLAVNGDIFSTKVKVTQTGWPDYVFEKDYQLPSLAEVEAFIETHKHLPGIPSAKEIEASGLDLGNNQALLLKKIEELTLYTIQLQHALEEQEKKMQAQQEQLKKELSLELQSLRKEIESLKSERK